MSNTLRRRWVWIASALLCGALGVPQASEAQAPSALGETATPPVTPTGTAAPQREARTRLRFGADWQLASWLIAEHESRAALVRFAQTRLVGEEAKRRAQAVLEEHEQMLQRLRPFADLQDESEGATDRLLAKPAEEVVKSESLQTLPAGPASAPTRGKPASNDKDPPRATIDVTTPATAAPVLPVPSATVPTPAVGGDAKAGVVVVAKMSGPGFDLVSLKRELAAENLKSWQAALAAREGEGAERWFVAWDSAVQAEQLDVLRVFRLHASSKLQATIDEQIPQVESRLQRAQAGARR